VTGPGGVDAGGGVPQGSLGVEVTFAP